MERAIASAWHRFDGHEQFAYRDALHALAGEERRRVAPWEIEMYDAKGVLRAEWRALERSGEAAAWVKGVGTGADPKAEWVALLRRLLERAVQRQGAVGSDVAEDVDVDVDEGKSRL